MVSLVGLTAGRRVPPLHESPGEPQLTIQQGSHQARAPAAGGLNAAGLLRCPKTGGFIHKTGTLYQRACHAGVISPEGGGARAIVVAACTADLDEQQAAGPVLTRVGRAISETVLAAPR